MDRKTTFFIKTLGDQESDPIKHDQEIVEQVQAKRTQRHERQLQHIQTLKEKLAQKEISIDLIKAKIKDFKISGLQKFVENLNKQGISAEVFQARLEEKLEISLSSKLVNSIHEA